MNSTNTSEILSTASTNYRQKGKLPSTNAKLYKGFIHDASSKLSVGSIPSRFETIVYRNQSQKAFGSSNQRFSSSSNDIPGPQEYDYMNHYAITHGKAEESLSKLSKNGLGGFATQAERVVFDQKYVNTGPGPGDYKEASFFNASESSVMRTSQISKVSSNFRKPSSSEEQLRNKVIPPGPGEYDATLPRKVNTYKSSFISRSQRDQYMTKFDAPAPGQYNIPRTIVKKHPENIGPSSSFHPEGNHQKDPTTQQKLMKFLEDPEQVRLSQEPPGPCDYNPKVPDFLPEYMPTKEMSSFKQASIDRFGDPVDPSKVKHDGLGPGQYNLKGQLETIAEEKQIVSGSAFMSEVLRKPFGDYAKRLGPNPNLPYVLPKKKNYHLNLQRKWV